MKSTILCSSLLLACLSHAALAQGYPTPKDTRTPDHMPTAEELKDPPKSWIDKDTGHRVIRLTNEPGSASFYFNVNAYTPDGTEMIYTTPEGISVLNLKSMETRSVVKGRVRTIVVGHKTPSVFYIKPDEQQLYVTNVDTGETRMIGKIPAHGNIDTVNADETLAAGTYDEVAAPEKQYNSQAKTVSPQGSPLEQPANKGEMMERRLAARIPLVLYTLNLNDGKITPLLHSTDWINHLLFSPANPEVLMYCHEGPWQKVDRIWTIHTDGTHNQLMHKRTMFMEIAGHEFWGWDGDTVYYDLQTPKGEDFWLASLNLNDGKITPLLHSTDWINHLLFSPANPEVLMYCHEGPWQKVDRIWTIHTDGTHNQLMHKRTMFMEIAGHEFWGWDGDTVYYDLQTPKGEDFWLASLNLNDGEQDWYHMDRNEWSIHFNVSKDKTMFAGDGGDPGQVAKAPNGEWIYLFRPQMPRQTDGINDKTMIQPRVFQAEKLVNMSKHNYTLEPNVSFTPDQKMIIFRSNMFGPTYVFGVEIAKPTQP